LEDGRALFPKAEDASKVYGASPISAASDSEDRFNGHVEHVPAYSLESLLADFPSLDLIHCDIQGSELDLFKAGIGLASRKVKRLVIGTHSWQIDRGLIGLFASRGWVLEGAEECLYRGGVFSGDGTQVWRNPHLTG
jgi:hypothetical protein